MIARIAFQRNYQGKKIKNTLKGSSSRLHWSLKDPNFEGWWTWGCGGSLKMSAQYLRSFHYAYAEETDQLT